MPQGSKNRILLSLVAVAAVATLLGPRVLAHPDDKSTVEAALHALVEQGEITEAMHKIFDQLYENGNSDNLVHYLESLAKRGEISADTHVYLQTALRAGVPEEGSGPLAAAPANYTGNGNVTLLGQLNPRAPFTYYGDNSSGKLYEGIWGYASGGREYALITHSDGLTIIEITDPANPIELQFIPMPGGRVHRDVDTYYHASSGKTYAYVGGQENSNLYSVDLSYLPGTIPGSAIVDLGRTNWAHTLQVSEGLLFTNNAGSSLGCRIFDVQANPANPPLLTGSWSGSGRDCHDSFTRNNILYSSDGYSTRWRTADISGVRGGASPVPLGESAVKSGMYAHSGWLTDDSNYLFTFEESKIQDINVYDVSNPANLVNVATFQWSGDGAENSIVHNGQIKGDLLYVAYYEAGFRVFDISNRLSPVEVGKYETWRDPDGDDVFDRSITGSFNGAWNLYAGLPSGYILVSDMRSGLFVFQVTNPTPTAPDPPTGLAATPGNGQVGLTWLPSAAATGYNVKRAASSGGPYAPIASDISATNFTDSGLTNGTTYYYVVSALNGGLESADSGWVSGTPAAPPAVIYNPAVADSGTNPGTIFDGSYQDTVVQDGVYEVLSESQQGGNPRKARSLLTHTWTFDVAAGASHVFKVDAFHSANNEGDEFEFSYSTDGTSFTPMLTVTKTADGVEESYSFTQSLSGTVYVRVSDTDSNQGNTFLDTLSVDWLSILTVSNGTDVEPPLPPTGLNATVDGSDVDLDWANNTEPDLAGYRVYRSASSGGPYTEISGSLFPASQYTDTPGTGTFYYIVRAEDTSSNLSNASDEVSAVVRGSGGPTSVHVASIVTSTINVGGGNKLGQAVVMIVNDLGQPVSSAEVSGTFSSPFNESASGTTGLDGSASIVTASPKKGNTSFTFCVTDVTAALPYDSAQNAVSCAP